MPKIDHTKGQSATELAVFGAILIFILGTIVRTGVGNSFTQNNNFKAMRMALLASWNEAKSNPGFQASQSTTHNSASVLFVEDRLSPDYNKYGDLDRNPYIAQGGGSFSYNLLYPLTPGSDVSNNLPIMDVYINGIHFPFTTAAYVQGVEIEKPPSCPSPGNTPQDLCTYNQCLRNQREWAGGSVVGGSIAESAFDTNNPQVAPITGTTDAERTAQMASNACIIYSDLAAAQIFSSFTNGGQTYTPNSIPANLLCNSGTTGTISAQVGSSLVNSSQWQEFINKYEYSFQNNTPGQNSQFLTAILNILTQNQNGYKLFYAMVAQGQDAPSYVPYNGTTFPVPKCTSPLTKDQALCRDLILPDANGNPHPNTNGDMQFDLQRLGIYDQTNPSFVTVASGLRPYMSWEWSATPGTTAAMIGLNAQNNQYPSYDIDGRLKPVTIYAISQNNGNTVVTYEDSQGGDIDSTWDQNSCTLKPGLETGSQVFTFTMNGTYLQINEGQLYNPQSGEVVRSANKRDTIDLVQRTIRLSNNTTRFCTPCKDGSACGGTTPNECADKTPCSNTDPATNMCTNIGCANPNPVEVCVNDLQASMNQCFTSTNMPQVCYDTTPGVNSIYVRSRLQDTRGDFWLTNTSGQLQVH